MPSLANITVKNAANVDVVYVGAIPSAGDKMPARWTLNAASAIIGFRPMFQLATRDNGNKTGRVFTATMSYPIIETIAGVATKTAQFGFTLEGTLPTNVDGTLVQDAFVQLGNLLVSTLVRSSASEGYAPT